VGYIERDVVGDGQWVRVTDAGEAALRAEYADYRRLFETDVELVLRGAVTGGMGEGATTSPCPATPSSSEHGWATSRSRARSTSISRRRASAGAARWPASMRCRSTRGKARTTYGAASSCYGVTLVTGDERYEEVHAIVPDRTHHDDDQLELIAPERLRDALGLGDGDAVEVRVAATSRADTPESDDVEESDDENETPADPVETEVA